MLMKLTAGLHSSLSPITECSETSGFNKSFQSVIIRPHYTAHTLYRFITVHLDSRSVCFSTGEPLGISHFVKNHNFRKKFQEIITSLSYQRQSSNNKMS